jgi:hypothetical protein
VTQILSSEPLVETNVCITALLQSCQGGLLARTRLSGARAPDNLSYVPKKVTIAAP